MVRLLPSQAMKAITLKQPDAELVALRSKRYATFTWYTNYRGALAIHASLEFTEAARRLCRCEPFATALLGNEDLPLGCVVAICDLAAVVPTSPQGDSLFGEVQDFPESELPFGDFSPGRYAWHLTNVRALENPIPARGSQSLWEWDEGQLGLLDPQPHQPMKKKLTKTAPQQYRQGDVLIERVASLPSNLTKQKPEAGRIILAHGEVTGHAHAFDRKAATKFLTEKGEEFFEVKGVTIHTELPLLRQWKNQVMVKHPHLGVLEFALSDVTVRGDRVSIAGDFGLLTHDEHATHAIPAGFYKGGSGNGIVRQREYTPEAIRKVAD